MNLISVKLVPDPIYSFQLHHGGSSNRGENIKLNKAYIIKIFLLQETQFVVDEVSNVIKEAIETTIGGNSYTVLIITTKFLLFFFMIYFLFIFLCKQFTVISVVEA